MSTTLNIENFSSLNIKETSSVSADAAAAATTLVVENGNTFAADDFVYVGNTASENGEITTVSAKSGNSLTVGALGQAHNAGERVLLLYGEKIRIYRAANVDGTQPADGSFSLLATVSIDPDQTDTIYTDTSGSSAYWYKFVYYNSTLDSETSLADSGAARGGAVGQYTTVDDIRKSAGFDNNRNISNSHIERFRQVAQAEVNGALSGRYTVPLDEPINDFVSYITTELAAGYLMKDQYGEYGSVKSDEAKDKIDWANKQLEKIRNGEIVLTDSAGNETAETAGLGLSGYPNNSTADRYGNNDFMFKRTSIDGYNGRRY